MHRARLLYEGKARHCKHQVDTRIAPQSLKQALEHCNIKGKISFTSKSSSLEKRNRRYLEAEDPEIFPFNPNAYASLMAKWLVLCSAITLDE